MRCRQVLFLSVLASQCGAAWAAHPALPLSPSKVPAPCAVVVSRKAAVRVPELVPANKVLTLNDCIRLAIENQQAIREAEAQLNIASGNVGVSGSALGPILNLNGSEQLAGSQGGGVLTSNGSVDQLIYDFQRSRSQLTASEQAELSDFFSLEASAANTIFSVQQTYYGLLKNNRLVAVFAENLKDQNDHVALAQARLAAGVAARADVLQAQASAASAKVDLINAQNAAAQAQVSLNAAMGIDIRSQSKVAEGAEPEIPVPAENDIVMQAIRNRPEVAQAVEVVNSDVYSLSAAKTGNLPVLSGVANGQEQNLGGLTTGWQLALNLQWTPFDSGRTRGEITAAEGQLMLSEESLYGVRQSVSQDATSARFDLIAAKAALVASNAEVASAKENLAVATGQYEAGVGIFLQVLDAQSTLLKAEVDQATAKYGLSIALAEVEHAIGEYVAKGIFR